MATFYLTSCQIYFAPLLKRCCVPSLPEILVYIISSGSVLTIATSRSKDYGQLGWSSVPVALCAMFQKESDLDNLMGCGYSHSPTSTLPEAELPPWFWWFPSSFLLCYLTYRPLCLPIFLWVTVSLACVLICLHNANEILYPFPSFSGILCQMTTPALTNPISYYLPQISVSKSTEQVLRDIHMLKEIFS